MNETATRPSAGVDNKSKYYYTIRYAIFGVTFGLLFPTAGTFIVLLENGIPISLSTAFAIHYFEPLLWIIDTAPLFLGLCAALVGRREDRLQETKRQLEDLVGSLEKRITVRERDLDRAVEVGHTMTQVSNLDEMLAQAVELIRSSFELYYAQVFLLDSGGRNLVLRAGTGNIGRALVNQNQRLSIGFGSIVGTAALEKQTLVVANTATSKEYQPNPYLPDTSSEIAMPLLLGDQLVGVLDLHSDETGKLTAQNLPALEAVAGQLAIAVQNAHLVAEATAARAEIENRARRITRRRWQDFLNAVERSEYIGFSFEANNIKSLDQPLSDYIGNNTVSAPILVTGETVGSLQVDGDKNRNWSRDERELVTAVAEQVAIQVESLRLLAEADYYRAEAEEATRRLTREVWEEYLFKQQPYRGGYSYDQSRVDPLIAQPNGDIPDEAMLAHPLTVRGETIGRLEVAEVKDLDEEATELVAAVAQQLSSHLEKLRLAEQTERALAETEEQAKRLVVLNELSQALASAATLDDIYKITAIKTDQIIPTTRISIAVLSSNKERFKVFALHGEKGVTKVGDVPSTKGSILTMAVEEKRVVSKKQSGDRGLPGIESFMVAPLTAGGQTFGTLNVGHSKPNAFDNRDERLLLQVASLLAATLESQRLLSETVHRAEELAVISQTAQSRADEMAILNEMGQALTSLTDMPSIMNTVYYHTSRLMDSSSFFMALYDAERDEVEINIFGEGEEIDSKSLRRRTGNGITEFVIRARKPLLIQDDMAAKVEELGIELQGGRAKSWLGVPMTTGDQVIGIVAVQSFDRTFAFDDHHKDLLSAVANQAAIAIENVHLFEQAQARAQRERILREITARVRSSADVDSVMRTAAQEVGRALGRQTFVYLGEDDDELPATPLEEN